VLGGLAACAVVAGVGSAAAVVTVVTADPPPCEACEGFATGEVLQNPPVMQSRRGLLDVVMTPRTRTVDIGGRDVSSQTYASTFAAPTWVVDPGDDLNVLLRNRLPAGYLPETQDLNNFVQPKGAITNLHVHGLNVSPKGNGDNVLQNRHHNISSRAHSSYTQGATSNCKTSESFLQSGLPFGWKGFPISVSK
jgi:FtsP/CotA-like multicopper oxidase with cupredoxin domain